MKSMKRVDLLQTIRVTKVSFVALILFVGMSIGNLFGTEWSGPAVSILANNYYNEHNVMDLKAMSGDGFGSETVDKIRDIDDVAFAEGIYLADATMRINGVKELFSVSSVTDSNINKIDVIEGKLPEKENEIAIDTQLAKKRNYSIGEFISLDSSLKELTGYDVSSLKHGRFKITGFVNHPEYSSLLDNVPLGFSYAYRRAFNYYALVDESAFDERVYENGYSSVLMRMKSLDGIDRFADDYNDRIQKAKDNVTDALGEDTKISFTDLTSSFGYYSVDLAKGTGSKVSKVFAGFFFLVGLLVCYSTVLRVVEEEKRLIGTKMANGFSRVSVASKYLSYVAMAVTLGVLLGIGNAVVISTMTQKIITSFLTFGGSYNYYDVKQMLIVIAFEYAAMLLIAWIASAKQLREKITNLLINNRETSKLFSMIGKTSWAKKASVSIQSFLYNVSMDGSRVFATIVGMVGSIALLIAPASLFLALQESPQVQFDELFHFSHTIQYEGEESGDEAVKLLKNAGASYAEVCIEDAILETAGDKATNVRLVAVDDIEELEKMVKFVDPETESDEHLDNDGVLVWQAEGKDHGTKAGDELKVSAYSGENYKFKVSGLYRCYDPATYRMFMTSDTYERVTGNDFANNAILTDASDGDLLDDIARIEGVLGSTDDTASCMTFYRTMSGVFAGILGLAVMMSAIIAFLILLNLNIQFVQEKKMELIVMRINGFSVGKARMYIIRDNIFLSILSIIIGVIAGIILAGLLNSSMQMPGMCMIDKPSVTGCVFGVTITTIYMIITNIIAVRPIGRLDLTDISKM